MSLLAEEFQKCINNFEERSPVITGADRVNAIMRWEEAQNEYESRLEIDIGRASTIAGLQRLKKNYEAVSRKKLNKKHPLYTLYRARMDQIIETL